MVKRPINSIDLTLINITVFKMAGLASDRGTQVTSNNYYVTALEIEAIVSLSESPGELEEVEERRGKIVTCYSMLA